MIQDIFVGGYVAGESMIHRLDPRTKLAGMMIMLVMVFLAGSPSNHVLACASTAIVAALTALGVRVWLWSLKRFMWMLVLAATANALMVREGSEIVIGSLSLPLTDEGLYKGLLLTVQLAEAIVLSMVLTFTTSPIQITKAFSRLARPLKRLVPIEEIGLVLLLAMRFVPLLQQELRTIVDAQKSRGVEFGRGSPAVRASNLGAVLVPALSGTIRRADILAGAMASRGFQPGRPRSEYAPLEFHRADAWAALFIAVYAILQTALFTL